MAASKEPKKEELPPYTFDDMWRVAQEQVVIGLFKAEGPKRVLLLDTETTGLDPRVDRCIEVAATLFDLEHGAAIESYASLIRADSNAAEDVNNIPSSLLKHAPPPDRVWDDLDGLFSMADLVVAHRADFDRAFVIDHLDLGTITPWCCSKFDITWPRQRSAGSDLLHLALAHGVGVTHAHRAQADVDVLSRLFTRVHEAAPAGEGGAALRKLFRHALRPRRKFMSLAAFSENQKVKAAGFAFDGAAKKWFRWLDHKEAQLLPFPVRIVQPST